MEETVSLGDYRIDTKGETRGNHVYRDRTISTDVIAKEAMVLVDKFDYIKVYFKTKGKQRMIHYRHGFEGPAKANSDPRIDGSAIMVKNQLTLNYQLPVMQNGIAFVVDTNHNREILRRMLKTETADHYEIYYEGNKPLKKKATVTLGPFIELLSDIDIQKNTEGVSHILNMSPTDKKIFEALLVESERNKSLLEEANKKLAEKGKSTSPELTQKEKDDAIEGEKNPEPEKNNDPEKPGKKANKPEKKIKPDKE